MSTCPAAPSAPDTAPGATAPPADAGGPPAASPAGVTGPGRSLPPWAAVMQPVVVHLPLLDVAARQVVVTPVTQLTWLEAAEARWRLMGLPWLGGSGADVNAASACGVRVSLSRTAAPPWRIVVDARSLRVPPGLTRDRILAAVLDAARRNLGAASPVAVEVVE